MKLKEQGLINLQYIDSQIMYYKSETKRLYDTKKYEQAQYNSGMAAAYQCIKNQLINPIPVCEDIFHAGVQYGAAKEDYSDDTPNMITFLNSDIPVTPKAIISKKKSSNLY